MPTLRCRTWNAISRTMALPPDPLPPVCVTPSMIPPTPPIPRPRRCNALGIPLDLPRSDYLLLRRRAALQRNLQRRALLAALL